MLQDSLVNKFMDMSNTESMWTIVNQTKEGDYQLQIHRHFQNEFCFRLICDFETTPEEAFDLMGDISLRPNWDSMCQEAGVLQQIDSNTRVQYFRTRGLWPTAPRIALVVCFTLKLPTGYLNITQSIDDHPNFVEPDGDVRMVATLAGLLVTPHPSGDKNRCRMIQIMDGDLGGWLPKSVVAMLTTQAFPVSMKQVNSLLKAIPNPKTVSSLIQADSTTQNNVGGTVAMEPIQNVSMEPIQIANSTPSAKAKPVSRFTILSIIGFLYKILKKSQPLLIFALVFSHFYQKYQK